MDKEREIEILEYRISDLNKKIENFERYNIDERKIQALIDKRTKYENQLANLQ